MTDDEERDWLGVWLSRVMFGWIFGPPFEEARPWPEYRAAVIAQSDSEPV